MTRATAIGLFCAFLPFPGQMVIAAMAAITLQANLPVAIMLVWITNPITIPFIFYFTYRVGVWLLDWSTPQLADPWSMELLFSQFISIGIPLLSGSLFCGTVVALVGAVCLQQFWIYWVRKIRKENTAAQ